LYHRVTTKGHYVYHKDIRPDKNDVELEAQRARGGYVTGRFEREWLNSRQGYGPSFFGGIRTHFCRELSAMVTFLDAACVNPSIFQLILAGLFAGIPDFFIALLR
jgi:hypothetical protein